MAANAKAVPLYGPAVANLLQTPIHGKDKARNISYPLPQYSARADYLSSVHCRLCLADCSQIPVDLGLPHAAGRCAGRATALLSSEIWARAG